MRAGFEDEAVFTGEIENVVYHNEANGYTVFRVRPADWHYDLLDGDEPGQTLTCTAYTAGLNEGETVKVSGAVVFNPRYGKQVLAKSIERAAPETLAGIEKYIGSGVIKGVGERTAKRIVERFGLKTFDIIEEEPDKLTEIRGITISKAQAISEAFHAQASLRTAMLFLQDFGITPVRAIRIYKRYQERTVDLVRSNPYRLAEDIDGIGFRTADLIAARIGYDREADHRVSAGILFTLREASNNGHIFLYENELVTTAAELLGVSAETVDRMVGVMQLEHSIYVERPSTGYTRENHPAVSGNAVFLKFFYDAEKYIASRLVELSEATGGNRREYPPDLPEAQAVNGSEITLSEGQRNAVHSALISGMMVLTGGPGTGKTTAINTIIELLERERLSVEIAAPTGRAAKRMSEATGREAKTIHRLLETSYIAEDSRKQIFNKNEKNPIEADALIIDEVSMVDVMLMQSLLRAVAAGTRLILVGDSDQLPSIGPGNVLNDIVRSGCFPVTGLTEIFRQAGESAIVMNAHRINRGEYPIINQKKSDFFFITKNTKDEVAETVLELVSKRLPGFLSGGSSGDIQVLTPMRKSELGSVSLNLMLQRRLNPPSGRKREREFRSSIFREGDRVMQINNNYSAAWRILDKRGRISDEGEGVFNGDCGRILSIDEDAETVTVEFDDDRRVDYDFTRIDELEHAFAMTVHKAQGSEYRAVVVPLFSGPGLLMSRNLLYTAVTRARELVVMVGRPETLYRMVDNDREVLRNTSLSHRLNMLRLSGTFPEPISKI